MNASEICEYIGIHLSTLDKWKNQNKIPYKRLGKRIFYTREEVIKALEDSRHYKIRSLQT